MKVRRESTRRRRKIVAKSQRVNVRNLRKTGGYLGL